MEGSRQGEQGGTGGSDEGGGTARLSEEK
ncbi:hypothetical protein E2C01_049192 [Portunus trituberculatus]|uniref:Uncharacterized protein n=1 Tax=Portunus trituberculatus TaxID=210409 RepID=A0A5B7G4Z6_PORTR|nr:hypothetical protein [Portunus trituberculatus]